MFEDWLLITEIINDQNHNVDGYHFQQRGAPAHSIAAVRDLFLIVGR